MKTESNFLRHIECPKCGSSDGNALFDDGHTFCYVCHTHQKAPRATIEDLEGLGITSFKQTQPEGYKPVLEVFKNTEAVHVVERGISAATMHHYGAGSDGKNYYFPYCDAAGKVIAAKIRGVEEKTFSIQGDWKHATLFGQNKFTPGGKAITITEGEFDALAAYQLTGSRFPVVSVRNGAQAALKDCRASFEYLDSFDRITICFDNDEPGKAAANQVAELFGSKAHIFKPKQAELKDACDYLAKGLNKEFVDTWWDAEQFTPGGIISASSLLDDLKTPLTKAPVSYPWQGLNKMLYGLRTSEMVVLAAGSGLGKSTIVREIVSHILNNTTDKVGLAFLEETPERTMRGLLGLEMAKKIHLPDAEYAPSEIDAVYDRLDLNNRVYLWDHFGSNNIENVINRLKYFVKGLECKWLVLDHLSILVSDQAAGDERKNIDMVMTKLRTFVQEMDCGLLLVSHLKRPEGKSLEDGAVTSLGMLRGSAAIGQLADAVIGVERNSQATDLRERNTNRVRVLKSRYTGYTGPACSLLYDDRTGRLAEMQDEEGL